MSAAFDLGEWGAGRRYRRVAGEAMPKMRGLVEIAGSIRARPPSD